MEYALLILLFFIIAAIYASAGFGGGSSYLAVMALWGIQTTTMKSTALLCNLVVVVGGTYIFWKNGYLNVKKITPRGFRIIPLCIASVPMAFWGGSMKLKDSTFFIVLGLSLVAAALLMFFQKKNNTPAGENTENSLVVSTGMGAGIGFLSGMVGIGGGIFLSPILNMMRWDTPKNIAATASFFILVNSIAGLGGQLYQNQLSLNWGFALPLMLAVLVGGQLGSRISSLKFNQSHVRWATAVLIFYAGLNILWTHI